MKVESNLKSAYDNQYDDSIIEWRRITAKYKAQNIIELAKGLKLDTVLEVGCGEGAILQCLSEKEFCKNLCGIDISESGIQSILSKNITHLKEALLFDGYKIPYDDNSFDLAICSHVMEHVEHERILLREIKRVSKYQIFEVPIDFSFYVDRKIDHFLSYGHINIYTPGLFRFLLISESFEIIKDKCHLYEIEVVNHIYKNNFLGYWTNRIKFLILKNVQFLKGIKPSSYAVLTGHAKKNRTIF